MISWLSAFVPQPKATHQPEDPEELRAKLAMADAALTAAYAARDKAEQQADEARKHAQELADLCSRRDATIAKLTNALRRIRLETYVSNIEPASGDTVGRGPDTVSGIEPEPAVKGTT